MPKRRQSRWASARITQRAQEVAVVGIEGIDPAARDVVAHQDRIAEAAEIGRRLRQAPRRMQWTADRSVSLQSAVGAKLIYEPALSFVERSVGHPDIAIDVLNAVRRKVSRDIGILEGIGRQARRWDQPEIPAKNV